LRHRPVDDSCWTDVLGEVRALRPRTVLISSEDFCWIDREAIERVRAKTKDFRVRILAYLCNQLGFIQSYYKQEVKTGRTGLPFTRFLREHVERCNYPALLQKWANCFGRDNMHVRPCAKQKNEPGIIEDVMPIMGVNTDTCLGQERTPDINISPGDDVIEVIRLLSKGRVLAAHVEKRTGLRGLASAFARLRWPLVWSVYSNGRLGRLLLPAAGAVMSERLPSTKDADWLRDQTKEWNDLLFNSYLDPRDRAYLDS